MYTPIEKEFLAEECGMDPDAAFADQIAQEDFVEWT